MTSRERRVVIAGTVLLIAVVGPTRMLPAVADKNREMRDHAFRRLEALTHAREVLSRSDQYRDSLAVTINAVVTDAPLVVVVGTAAEAAAALSLLISSHAARADLRVVSLTPTADSSSSTVNSVSVRAEFEGRIAGVAKMLEMVESGHPVLSIASFDLSSPEALASDDVPERLVIEMQITGAYIVREAA